MHSYIIFWKYIISSSHMSYESLVDDFLLWVNSL